MTPELRKRVKTAATGLVPFLALILFGGRFGVGLIAAGLSLGMIHEFSDMILELPDRLAKQRVLLGTSWLVSFVNFWIPRSEYELLLFSFMGLFGYFLFTADRHHGEAVTTHFRELMSSFFGILYLGFLPLYLVLIRDSAGGLHWTLLFLLIIWSVDVGAYFVGKSRGKRKLYPMISPNKTVEGLVGGMGCAVVVALLYKLLFFRSLSFLGVLFLPVLLAVVSQVGDLCESFLKRAFHRKDSGSLLPGHGGFLDRFDGVIFSLPFMYACIRVFG